MFTPSHLPSLLLAFALANLINNRGVQVDQLTFLVLNQNHIKVLVVCVAGWRLLHTQHFAGGPANYYKITVYAMPTATTTFNLGGKNGLQIDTEIRAQALAVSNFTVCTFPLSFLCANQMYRLPTTAISKDPLINKYNALVCFKAQSMVCVILTSYRYSQDLSTR